MFCVFAHAIGIFLWVMATVTWPELTSEKARKALPCIESASNHPRAVFLSTSGCVVNQYRGSGGGIRSISYCDDGQRSVFAVCGLDRYLRVFAAEPPTLLHKVHVLQEFFL